MLSCLNRISINRYLIVWRVNSSLAFIPGYLSLELSRVIGSIIAQRLPSSEKTAWKKTLDPLIKHHDASNKNRRRKSVPIPDVAWPINSTLLVYPGKRTYGKDELIFWELKLFGEHADHGLFLEVILPAMEEAGFSSDPKWNQKNRLWGHFDIQHIFAARGNGWEPVVQDGKLDLRYRATPFQWCENLKLKPTSSYHFSRLNWMSPFDFVDVVSNLGKFDFSIKHLTLLVNNAPTLPLLLLSLIFRIDELLHGRSKILENVGEFLSEDERKTFHQSLEKISRISMDKNNIRQAPTNWPGRYFGVQQFKGIPRA
ncbi:MAG: hypothetical protein MUC94_18035, partial [bacterium]|nr:hypothetical protein [bacterium]